MTDPPRFTTAAEKESEAYKADPVRYLENKLWRLKVNDALHRGLLAGFGMGFLAATLLQLAFQFFA